MIDYPALAAVAAVVTEGSFERAAGALGITPSAISQRIRGLEERLGAILIVRGQPCRPTALGRSLVAHFDKVRLMEAELAPVLGSRVPRGDGALTIKIAVNADSLATWFPAAAAAFGRDAAVSLDLTLDDEAHTADRLRAGEVLAAVTASPGPVQGCRTHPLGALRYAACVSPAFVARYFPDGVDAAALGLAPQLRFDRRDRLQARWAADSFGLEPAGPIHWVPSTQAFLDLALAGLAWGMQPLVLAERHIAAGRLVDLAPGRRLDVDLYWTVARLPVASLRSLTAAVRAAAKRSLG
ncbi:LysR family transcriptional regulator ArgP [Methylobrevis albus]|uniref:LysR family transcriptional regulator ArgP n=1 Tax=Methylobrevis albus TaxID=2793297 RepID=A0A931N0E0_9HYPH|nr:LysR family transcriptional regulator ArgP [Methylobrevis albus]MBH0239079.1 LysR family transcriptional regulator ArgP [Methylobrevis albus]